MKTNYFILLFCLNVNIYAQTLKFEHKPGHIRTQNLFKDFQIGQTKFSLLEVEFYSKSVDNCKDPNNPCKAYIDTSLFSVNREKNKLVDEQKYISIIDFNREFSEMGSNIFKFNDYFMEAHIIVPLNNFYSRIMKNWLIEKKELADTIIKYKNNHNKSSKTWTLRKDNISPSSSPKKITYIKLKDVGFNTKDNNFWGNPNIQRDIFMIKVIDSFPVNFLGPEINFIPFQIKDDSGNDIYIILSPNSSN